MKQITKLTFLGIAALTLQTAVAAPPSLTILPDKTWCVEKGYVIKSVRNGQEVVREDYNKALIDKDFVNVASAIQQIMAERGFPVGDANQQQEADDFDDMLDEAVQGYEMGGETATDAYDELIKNNKPDIILKIGWNINTAGSLYSADYRINAFDSYSNKAVAPIAGQTGDVRRTVPLSVALKQTAKNNMDDFCDKLMTYFEDVQTNGREITLDIRIFDSAGITMSTPYGGEELKNIIYNWVSDNTVNHQFSTRTSGRNLARYNQVRIPLKDTAGRPLDAERWVDGLRSKLTGLGIKSENKSTGLGAARIYIGENGF